MNGRVRERNVPWMSHGFPSQVAKSQHIWLSIAALLPPSKAPLGGRPRPIFPRFSSPMRDVGLLWYFPEEAETSLAWRECLQ